MEVKICGLRTREDVENVNNASPKYAGFILSKSRRKIELSTAVELRKYLDKRIIAVGVFVNESISFVMEAIHSGAINMVQLHGNENQEYIRKVKQLTDIPIVKAIPVRNAEDILTADKLDCDYLLLDTYSAKVAGGCGVTFDWGLVPKKLNHPYFLAGGLSLANVKEATKTNAFALDVSSGVETDGIKDSKKIYEFVHYIKERVR